MKFFNIDLHVSVIEDIKHIFNDLGHEVTDWSISGHTWVFDKKSIQNGIITQENWKNLDKNMCDVFYDKYKNILSKYDGFICTYPPTFSLLYEKFDKLIIIVLPIRYEAPFWNNAEKWSQFNEYLQYGIDQKKIILISNNEYDSNYIYAFIKRKATCIPNLCEYFNVKYKYNSNNKFLLFSISNFEELNNSNIYKLNSPFSWEDFKNFDGIVHVPYNVSVMKIFEQYTANYPLFLPSKNFLNELYFDLYPRYENGIMTQLTFNRIFQCDPKSAINYYCKYDPNDYNSRDSFNQWIDNFDYYNINNMPYIQYYENFDHLLELTKCIPYNELSELMKEKNIVRKEEIYFKWNFILQGIK